MLLLHVLQISRGISSAILPYLGCSWDPHCGSFQIQGGRWAKITTPLHQVRRETMQTHRVASWGWEKGGPVYKSLSLRWVLTATLLPYVPHSLHPASGSQLPARDNDIPQCCINSQTHQPHISSFWLCLRCHIFIKMMLICTACTAVHICAHLLLCSLCPHLHSQQLPLVIPFFVLPCLLVAIL